MSGGKRRQKKKDKTKKQFIKNPNSCRIYLMAFPKYNPTFHHKRSDCLLCKALSWGRGKEVKIPCMAKVALMTASALSFFVSLPASRSCRQRNGGLLSSLHGLRPVVHLAIQGPWGREDFTCCGDTHTLLLKHNLYKYRATATIEGWGLHPKAADCVYPYSEWVCVVCWFFMGGWVPCDTHGLQADNPLTLSLTHKSTLKDNNGVCVLFFTFWAYTVKHIVKHWETCKVVHQLHVCEWTSSHFNA